MEGANKSFINPYKRKRLNPSIGSNPPMELPLHHDDGAMTLLSPGTGEITDKLSSGIRTLSRFEVFSLERREEGGGRREEVLSSHESVLHYMCTLKY